MTWADKIKRLDNYKCAFCGSVTKLEAHHHVKRSITPQLANDLENGITLCHKCHYIAHKGNYSNSGKKNYLHQSIAVSPSTMNDFIDDYISRKIVFTSPKENIDIIKAHAETMGESVNSFINRAIDQTIKSDTNEDSL